MNSLVTFYFSMAVCAFVAGLTPADARAQVSFETAVNQAIQNSPRMQIALEDVKKARAGLAVMKDIYIPSVVLGGGIGQATGITLSVPTIFTVSAQSLVYSPQQVSYVRSARLNLEAADYALADARNQALEDAAETYLTIVHDQAAVEAISQQFSYRLKLVSIIQDRVDAHMDNELDLKKARRDALQARLQTMQIQDFLDMQRAHLAELTGIPASKLVALADTIPDLPEMQEVTGEQLPDGPGILAAEAAQRSREMHAHGDAQYTWKPTMSFGAQYGRVSPIENVSEFYNLHGDYNSASVGVQIQFPLLDRVRSAASKVSAADAAHGKIDFETQRIEQVEEQKKLQRTAAELAVKAKLADLDYGIAQDELQSLLVALHSTTGSAPVTPKEEQNARIQERQTYLEMIDTRLDASRAAIAYLRQKGELQDWIESALPAADPVR